MAEALKYRRVVLKLSGEALLGEKPFGIDPAVVDALAGEVAAARARGAEIGLVIGGGNIFRGLKLAAAGSDRVTGDQLGMLATVMNALAFRDALTRREVPATVFSALDMPAVCERFSQRAALAALAAGEVAIFAAGTGNPFFSTDTGAALRAAEIGGEAILKGTQVDGVYSADPRTEPNAKRYERLSYDEVLARGLGVMDAAAVALARDNRIPLLVFKLLDGGSLVEVLMGRGRATIVS